MLSLKTDVSTIPVKVWLGIGFLCSVLITITYLLVQLSYWLEDEQQVPLGALVVAGDKRFLDEQDVERVVRSGQKVSFFELDVDVAHEQIEALPWVYRASVRKKWPSTLKVYVVEQTPVVRWNDDMLLNQYGEAFQAPLPEALQHLPVLFGPGGAEQTALQGFNAMQSLLKGVKLSIVELSLSERYAWQVRLQNGIDLNLGRTEFIDRLQRFIDLYPLLLKQEKSVRYVDLRYDTGLAVGWGAATSGTARS